MILLDGSSEQGSYIGVNQVLRFVEGIWLHRKSRQILKFLSENICILFMCATCSELPSYISTMEEREILGYCNLCGINGETIQ